MEAWSLRYYDQHGEPNGLAIALANPPAYMQATHHPTGKELRYYAEGEQRYQQLEQVARDMYRYMDGVLNRNWAYALPADTDNFRDQLEALGVSLDD